MLVVLVGFVVACGSPARTGAGPAAEETGQLMAGGTPGPAGTDAGGAPGEEATEGDMGTLMGDWYLTVAEGAGAQHLPPADREITLTLEEGRLSGSAGCNTYSAAYTLEGDRLIVGEVVRTEMACEAPELMRAQRAYLDALEHVEHAAVEADDLLLSGRDTVLRFARLMIPLNPEGAGAG